MKGSTLLLGAALVLGGVLSGSAMADGDRGRGYGHGWGDHGRQGHYQERHRHKHFHPGRSHGRVVERHYVYRPVPGYRAYPHYRDNGWYGIQLFLGGDL